MKSRFNPLIKNRVSLTACAALVIFTGQCAAESQQASPQWTPIPANSTFITGDTWQNAGTTYRLYGIQSCLRNSYFTNANGDKKDCGEVSMLMLATYIKDLAPLCYPIAQTNDAKTQFVICSAQVKEGPAKGSLIDLGTAMVASGFAFASIRPDGKPVYAHYYVSQEMAKEKKLGLWQFADLPDPNTAILEALPQNPPPP